MKYYNIFNVLSFLISLWPLTNIFSCEIISTLHTLYRVSDGEKEGRLSEPKEEDDSKSVVPAAASLENLGKI